MKVTAEKLGELLFLKLDESKWSGSARRKLKSVRPSGIILSARHCRSIEEPQVFIREARETVGGPLFCGLAGDRIQPDPFRAFALSSAPRFPAPIDVAPKGVRMVERYGALRGRLLALLGFNVDFHLSLDVAPPEGGSALSDCAFGEDSATVTACGSAYVSGLQQRSIMACAGHFPGIGSVRLDGPTRRPIGPKPMADLWRSDLAPFRELHTRLPLMRISNASYKAYDFDIACPAALSASVTTGLLRGKLGYEGVAVGDLEELACAWSNIDIGGGAVRALDAGCDALLIPGKDDLPEITLKSVTSAFDAGRISSERIHQALARIARAKEKLAVPQALGKSEVAQFAADFLKWGEDFAG